MEEGSDSDHLDIVIGSLPALIARLRDPDGGPRLKLNQNELRAITAYAGVDDFAEVYLDFIDAIKGNTTITKIELDKFVDKKGRIFPIVNPLLRHLPRAETLEFFVSGVSPVERFLFKDAARFENVAIAHTSKEVDDERVLELSPDLEVLTYVNGMFQCVNAVIGPVLLSLPYPSKLRELCFVEFKYQYRSPPEWNVEMARPLTRPELTQLVKIVQVSSLVKLTLTLLRFSSMEECSRFACGLLASPVKDLWLGLFTPDAANYRAIVSALSKMQHLESLDANLHLDEWHTDADTVGSFSIPAGDIVRGAPGLKTLTMVQGWKPWHEGQCRDLALALEAPSCGLKYLDISLCRTPATATVMSAFSSPSSSVEEFRIDLETSGNADLLVSRLPRRTNLRRLEIYVDKDDPPTITELQQEMFLSVVSGWYYLTHMNTFQENGFVRCCLSDDCREKLGTLLRLNEAGRHYLTSPTPYKADGVKVLIKVRFELNDIYTHLLENPCLCDRGVDQGVVTTTRRRSHRIRKKARNI